MKRAEQLLPDAPPFPTLSAEELAAEYLELHPEASEASVLTPFYLPSSWTESEGEGWAGLRPSRLRGVWQLVSPDRRVVALYTQERLLSDVEALAREQALPREASIAALPPGARPDPPEAFASLPAGEPLEGWQLLLRLDDPLLLDSSASRRMTAYLWTAALFILAIVVLAALMARFVSRQMKVARLKNDLVASVSHELKTPLSSIRVLVDTLLEGQYRDERRVQEYLELVSRENARLSRLIDDFLTFSRMERNRRAFELVPTDPAEVVDAAVSSARERFEAAGFRLDVEAAPGLPRIMADREAMVTVLLNLLDNAYKYTEEDKRVAVRAFERNGRVVLEVEDHGIGMSARACRKVFDRFYQVDESLSRRTGGVGLGLSIVRFIVEAHAGSVRAASRPGHGSTFTVELPVVNAPEAL
jgi:signal transduction histidine kinase